MLKIEANRVVHDDLYSDFCCKSEYTAVIIICMIKRYNNGTLLLVVKGPQLSNFSNR